MRVGWVWQWAGLPLCIYRDFATGPPRGKMHPLGGQGATQSGRPWGRFLIQPLDTPHLRRLQNALEAEIQFGYHQIVFALLHITALLEHTQ